MTTYGGTILRRVRGSRMMLLNAERPSSIVVPDTMKALHCVRASESHDPIRVSRHLAAIVGQHQGPVVVAPNTGDTPWEATRMVLAGMSASERSLIRVLGIVHSDMETQYALAERYLAVAPIWIGVSRRCAEGLRRRIGSRDGSVYELPYPIELAEVLARKPTRARPLRLAYVGRLEEPQKRVSRLATVLERLTAAGIEFSATVAGDGPARADFEERLQRAGEIVQQRVTLAGVLDGAGVADIWRMHDVCVLTSAYEGMPLALLEAMAAGVCPVVMAVESGLPELLEDRVNARVVPQGDIDAMTAVLRELAADREQTVRLGAAARETVRTRFSPEAHFARLEAIIGELWALPPPDPTAIAPDITGVAVTAIVARLEESGRPVAVFGAGMFGRKVVDACLNAGLAVVALADSDPARSGWIYRGLVCSAPESLLAHGECAIALGSMQFSGEMARKIADLAVQRGVPIPPLISCSP
ncbi:MAG: glycosyltransferase family 4 protein [Opitutaceae bacterium]|nr:glycosyltransferase family 4 protein [Opitutaceae bacterium]